MRAAILAVVGVLAAGPALASDKTDVMATVKAYVGALDKGDTAAGTALCARRAIIIDNFAPHVWQGAAACADWAASFATYSTAAGDTDAVVTTGKPKQLIITGDRGYAVYPAKYAYKEHGKPVMEQALWTFALQKLAAGWRITGWAWAQQ